MPVNMGDALKSQKKGLKFDVTRMGYVMVRIHIHGNIEILCVEETVVQKLEGLCVAEYICKNTERLCVAETIC